MSYIHDNEILKYVVDYQSRELIMYTQYKSS